MKTADDMEKAANKLAEMDIQGEKVLLTDKNGNVIIKIMQAKLWWVHRRRKYREIREKNHEEIRIWS